MIVKLMICYPFQSIFLPNHGCVWCLGGCVVRGVRLRYWFSRCFAIWLASPSNLLWRKSLRSRSKVCYQSTCTCGPKESHDLLHREWFSDDVGSRKNHRVLVLVVADATSRDYLALVRTSLPAEAIIHTRDSLSITPNSLKTQRVRQCSAEQVICSDIKIIGYLQHELHLPPWSFDFDSTKGSPLRLFHWYQISRWLEIIDCITLCESMFLPSVFIVFPPTKPSPPAQIGCTVPVD